MQEFYGVSLPDNTRVVVQTRRPVPSSSRLHNVMVSPQSCIDKPRSSSSKPDNVGASPSNNIESRRASSRGSNDRAVSLRKNTELSSRLNKAPTCSHKSIENPRPSSSSLDNGRVPTPRNTKVPRPSFPRPNDGMVSQPKDNERSRPCQHRDGFSSRKSEKLACAGSKDGSNSKSNIPKKLHPSLMVRNSRNAGQMPSVHARKEDQVIQTHRRNLGDNSFPKIGKDLSTHQTVKASSMGNNMELNTKSKRDDKFKRKRTEPLSEEELETLKMRTEPHEDHDSEEALNCKPVKRTRRYICNDDDDEDVDQNLVGVEGGTAPLTTQTIVLKSIEVSNSFVSESFKSRRKRIEPLSEEELETSMMRTEPHEDRDSVEAENRKQVKRTRRYICNDDDDDDDDADQNLVGVQGGTAPLTTQTTVLKSTEVSNSFVSESFKSRRKRIEPLSEEELETLMMRTELHEDRDSVEAENCKPVKRTRRYISNDDDDNDDDADQNLGGIEGGTAPLTTQTTVLKSTEVKNTFVSESFKLQPYSDLPIDEPIWSGVFKIGNKYVPLAAHLSVKHCDKVWKISRSLQPRVEVTKLSRLEAWPKSFEALGPTDDSIALYFLPHEMRQDADLDNLVREVMDNDMVLRAVVGEAEMLIFPSILLPKRHQTFKGKPYLWAVFKRREDKVATPTLHEEQHGIGRRAREEEKHASLRREGHLVAGLNMRGGLEAPEEAETQVTEQEQTASSARPNTPELAEGTAPPSPTPTMPAAMTATGGQIDPCFGAPIGALFGFIAGQMPRLEQLINEMRSEGALVVAMRTEMIGSGLGQTTAK